MVVSRDEIDLMGNKGMPRIFQELSPDAEYCLSIYKVLILHVSVAYK